MPEVNACQWVGHEERWVVSQFVNALHHPVSKVRLESYRPPGGTDLEMIVNYVWNIELSETLYPTLQVLEVSLRNGTHSAASTAYGTEFWFDQPGVLLQHQANEVADVRTKLIADHKQPTAGRIIAQLMFGFWTRLLNRPYEASFWHANNLAFQ